jgi:hypothetical protein
MAITAIISIRVNPARLRAGLEIESLKGSALNGKTLAENYCAVVEVEVEVVVAVPEAEVPAV